MASQQTDQPAQMQPVSAENSIIQSAGVSVFEPHHITSIRYPAFSLLQVGETFALSSPVDLEERHEPCPAVSDRDLASNTLTDSSFTSLTRVADIADRMAITSESDIFEDMEVCTRLPGETKLDMRLVPKGESTVIRIVRRTRTYDMDGGAATSEVLSASYEIFDSEWQEAFDSRGSEIPMWAYDVQDLLTSSSDRACCHIKSQFIAAGQDATALSQGWKPLRDMSFDINAPFKLDMDRFTSHENLERAFADLDQRWAMQNDASIIVDEEAIKTAWHVVNTPSPSLWDADRIWIFRNCPGNVLVKQVVHQIAKENDGKSMKVSDLHHKILERLKARFLLEFFRGKMNRFYSPKEIKSLVSDPYLIPLRAGFGEFLVKELNRLIQFLTVRDCKKDCPLHPQCQWKSEKLEANLTGLHLHGDRLYYMS